MKTGYQFIPKTENCSFLKSIEGTFHCTSFSTKIKIFPLQKLLKQHGQKHSLLMLIVFEKNVLFTMRKTQKKTGMQCVRTPSLGHFCQLYQVVVSFNTTLLMLVMTTLLIREIRYAAL